MKPRREPSPPTLAVLIDREIDALDRLSAAVAGGVKSPQHLHELDAQAIAIGDRLRAAFRQAGVR